VVITNYLMTFQGILIGVVACRESWYGASVVYGDHCCGYNKVLVTSDMIV
jgi:hypothetical protein